MKPKPRRQLGLHHAYVAHDPVQLPLFLLGLNFELFSSSRETEKRETKQNRASKLEKRGIGSFICLVYLLWAREPETKTGYMSFGDSIYSYKKQGFLPNYIKREEEEEERWCL
ncbi:unnamed protein product [Linum trigynum]|uniref:Uncharacterized protein n=1 Tax=Linum trigynum TaxID=586398 RepID=A0AAV2EKL7_9ROSI